MSKQRIKVASGKRHTPENILHVRDKRTMTLVGSSNEAPELALSDTQPKSSSSPITPAKETRGRSSTIEYAETKR
jgi:hypothetical protein